MADRQGTLAHGYERDSTGPILTRHHDEGDGTYAKASASHLRIWSAGVLDWIRWDGAVTGDELMRYVRLSLEAITPPRWRLVARRRASHLLRLHEESIEHVQRLTHLV